MQFMLWYCSILMSSRVDDSRQLVHLLELLYTSKIHRRHRQLMGSSLTSESGFNDSISRLSERCKRTVLSRFLLDLEWRGDRNQSPIHEKENFCFRVTLSSRSVLFSIESFLMDPLLSFRSTNFQSMDF